MKIRATSWWKARKRKEYSINNQSHKKPRKIAASIDFNLNEERNPGISIINLDTENAVNNINTTIIQPSDK